MTLVSNSLVHYQNSMVNYEIFRTKEMLLFKPLFYTMGEHFPFAIFTKNNSEWKLRSDIEKFLEEQFVEEIKTLCIK